MEKLRDLTVDVYVLVRTLTFICKLLLQKRLRAEACRKKQPKCKYKVVLRIKLPGCWSIDIENYRGGTTIKNKCLFAQVYCCRNETSDCLAPTKLFWNRISFSSQTCMCEYMGFVVGKWHWDGFHCEYVCFCLSFQQCLVLIRHSSRAITIGHE